MPTTDIVLITVLCVACTGEAADSITQAPGLAASRPRLAAASSMASWRRSPLSHLEGHMVHSCRARGQSSNAVEVLDDRHAAALPAVGMHAWNVADSDTMAATAAAALSARLSVCRSVLIKYHFCRSIPYRGTKTATALQR